MAGGMEQLLRVSSMENTQQKNRDGWRIGELAERAGVSVRTIRYYEQQGLLTKPRRSAQGHRLYRYGDLVRLELIAQGKALGLSLEEIKETFDLYEIDRTKVKQMRRALEIYNAHLAQIEQRLQALEALRANILRARADIEQRLASRAQTHELAATPTEA